MARPGRGCLLLLVAMLALGISHVDAAYRLTFQNGTSVEVQSYEDLGDAIRYPRLGGVVVVPKSSISAIEEAVHLPPPTQPAPASRAPSTTFPNVIPGVPETSRPYANPPAGPSPAVPRPAPVRSTPVIQISPFSMISGILNILGGFIIFMIAVSGVLFWFRLSGKYARKERTFPYEKARSLLTPAERSFYGVLCQALDHRYSIFAKVRLSDIVEVAWGTPRVMGHQNRINQKHVDFVVCDSTSFTPLLVIELDDSSHGYRNRRDRDAFLDAALAAAGLPILHVPAQHTYAPADLRVQVYGHMTTGAQTEVSV